MTGADPVGGDGESLITSWRDRGRTEARSAHDAVLRAGMSEGRPGHQRALDIFKAYTRDLGDGGNTRLPLLLRLITDVHHTDFHRLSVHPDWKAAVGAYHDAFLVEFDQQMMAWRATPVHPPPDGPDLEEAAWLGALAVDDALAALTPPAPRHGWRRFLPG